MLFLIELLSNLLAKWRLELKKSTNRLSFFFWIQSSRLFESVYRGHPPQHFLPSSFYLPSPFLLTTDFLQAPLSFLPAHFWLSSCSIPGRGEALWSHRKKINPSANNNCLGHGAKTVQQKNACIGSEKGETS